MVQKQRFEQLMLEKVEDRKKERQREWLEQEMNFQVGAFYPRPAEEQEEQVSGPSLCCTLLMSSL